MTVTKIGSRRQDTLFRRFSSNHPHNLRFLGVRRLYILVWRLLRSPNNDKAAAVSSNFRDRNVVTGLVSAITQ